MKKIILSLTVAMCILAAQAQERTGTGSTRQRLADLNAITEQSILIEKLGQLVEGDHEEDYLLAYSYYTSKDIKEKAAETKALVLKKFPNGRLSLQEQVSQIAELKDLDEKDAKFRALYQMNPKAGFGYLASELGNEFAAKGDEEKMKFYGDIYAANLTDGKGNAISKESVYARMATAMVQIKPDLAASYLIYGVDRAKTSLDDMMKESNPNANLLMRAQGNYFSAFNTYVYALSKGSNKEKAYQLIKEKYEAMKQDKVSTPANLKYVESTYVEVLISTKRYKEAFPLLQSAILEGNNSASLKTALKSAYIAVNGSEKGYVDFATKLVAEQEAMRKTEVAKTAINEIAPDFELKDVDGKTVKLADLKGKVVVLDFWATWCGPCKASFPIMQKAVDKYKNDPNVKFLFLHTWEKGTGEPTLEAKKYVVDNHYTFDVLMDLRDPDTKASAVATAYKVKGIPAKFIIDPKGRIRFNTSGSSADMDNAVKELSDMIEFARKN